MSTIYDNWERLVAATLRREQLWQLAHAPSMSSRPSDFSILSSPLPDLPFPFSNSLSLYHQNPHPKIGPSRWGYNYNDFEASVNVELLNISQKYLYYPLEKLKFKNYWYDKFSRFWWMVKNVGFQRGMKLLCCSLSHTSEELSARHNFDERDTQKLLLIGCSGSGTSTIFKQAIFLYKDIPFLEGELEYIKLLIQSNIYCYFRKLLEGQEHFEEEIWNESRDSQSANACWLTGYDDANDKESIYSFGPRLKAFSDWLLHTMPSGSSDVFSASFIQASAPLFEELLTNPAFQETFNRRSESERLPSVANYFLKRAVDIFKPDYRPSRMDILHAEGFPSSLSYTNFSFPQPHADEVDIWDRQDYMIGSLSPSATSNTLIPSTQPAKPSTVECSPPPPEAKPAGAEPSSPADLASASLTSTRIIRRWLNQGFQKKQPPLQRKVEILRRLIPGCRSTLLPDVLEEATNFISVLELQVRAMKCLVVLLHGRPRYQLIRATSNIIGDDYKLLEFQDVRLIIFSISLTDYDQFVIDDKGDSVNKMMINKDCFESMVTNPICKQMPCLLLLTKYDLFEEKIRRVPVDQCDLFNNFNPIVSRYDDRIMSNLAEKGFHYISVKFKELYYSLTGGKLYVAKVNCLEADSVDAVLKFASDILKRNQECNESFHVGCISDESLEIPLMDQRVQLEQIFELNLPTSIA